MPTTKNDGAGKIGRLLCRNVEVIIEKDHFEATLKSGRKLRIKHGIDPTGVNIHIGRAVALWKLKEFQELGHKIVIVIGDFTAQIGDPSDKLEKRPFLAEKEIKNNLKNYLPQIGKILDLKKTEIRRNSEWLSKLTFRKISELADSFTFQQILERENFSKRLEKNQPISLREGLYPLMQGYDSVAVKADVELGGADQLFNLLAGRKIQECWGQKPQDIMTTKMLLGTDGRKMSTSWGNVINIADDSGNMFGKVMALHDSMISEYLNLATALSETEISALKNRLAGEENPKNIKEKLALEIVKRYHGEEAAQKAAENFGRVFIKKETPENIPILKVKSDAKLLDILLSASVKSKNEARRLVQQNGVSIDKEIQKNPEKIPVIKGGETLKIGKRVFFRLKIE